MAQQHPIDPLTAAGVDHDGGKMGKRKAQELRDRAIAEATAALAELGKPPGGDPYQGMSERDLRNECVRRNIVAANVFDVAAMQLVLLANDARRHAAAAKVRPMPPPTADAPVPRKPVRMAGLPASVDGLYRVKTTKVVAVPGAMTTLHAGTVINAHSYGERGMASLLEQGIELEAVTPDTTDKEPAAAAS